MMKPLNYQKLCQDFVFNRIKKSIILLLIGWLVTFNSFSQFSISLHGGLSYIEHVSTGVDFHLGKRQTISLLCGSNFFINMHNFRNLFLQYTFGFNRLNVGKFTPKLGVKGGDSFFTDEYYRWHVLNVIPFVGVEYPLTNKMQLFFEAGAAFSFEQSVERIKQGEIGHYKELLPEIKVGMLYTLYRKK